MVYDREAIIEEVQRVAGLFDDGPITHTAFMRHSRVDVRRMVRKFGSWQGALAASGVGDRYSGRKLSPRMREQPGRGLTDEEILGEMRRSPP